MARAGHVRKPGRHRILKAGTGQMPVFGRGDNILARTADLDLTLLPNAEGLLQPMLGSLLLLHAGRNSGQVIPGQIIHGDVEEFRQRPVLGYTAVMAAFKAADIVYLKTGLPGKLVLGQSRAGAQKGQHIAGDGNILVFH